MAARGLVGNARFVRPFATRVMNTSTSTEEPPFPGVFAALERKTGTTGKYLLGYGIAATVLSKELLVCNAEVLVGGSVLGVCYALYKTVGPTITEHIDNRSQNILDLMNTKKNWTMDKLKEDIVKEEQVEQVLSIRNEMFDIHKEVADMEREEAYRKRLNDVKTEVKRRLEYQFLMESLHKEFEKRHLVSWLKDNVQAALVNKQDDSIPQCIASLKKMSMATTS